MNFLTPAIKLLNRLKYSKKFIFFGSVVMSIVIFLSVLLYQQLNQVIVDSKIQLEGVEKVVAVNDLIKLSQEYRGFSAANKGNTRLFIDVLAKKEQQTEIALYDVINTLDPSMTLQTGVEQLKSNSDLEDLSNLKGLSDLFEQLKRNHVSNSSEEDFIQHTYLVHQLRQLTAIMGDHYKLVTEGVLPSYYMIDLILNNIPDTAESMGKMRGIMVGGLTKKHLSEANKVTLIQLESNLKLTTKQLEHNFTKVIRYSPHLAKQSNDVFSSLIRSEHKIIGILNNDLYNENFETNPEVFWAEVTANINNVYALMHDSLVPSLNAHLEQRIKKESTKLISSLTLVASLLLIIFYFLIALYKALLTNIKHISSTVSDYSQGNLETRIKLTTQDEMRDICISVNLMADRANQAQETIDKERQLFKMMFETSGEGHVVIEDGVFTACNEKAVSMMGYDTKSELMKAPHELSPEYQPDNSLSSEKAAMQIAKCLKEGTNHFEWMHQKKNGTDFWVDVLLTRLNSYDKDIILVTWRDITAQKLLEVENELTRKENALSSRIFNETNEGVLITDSLGNITTTNPAFTQITGYSREDVIGKNASILSSGRQGTEFYTEMWETINDHGHWQGEVWNRKKDGEIYAELLSISSLKDSDDKVIHYVGIFTDITLGKKQQETLELMAHYDVLTELPNRILFADRFSQAIAHSKRTKSLLGVCFLDLDHFKPVNDHYGHDIGDRLLIEVATRIKESIREEDTVSRQGGDEFALLLGDIENYAQCEQTLERIHYALAQPYLFDDKSLNITASTGVTLYPHDDEDIDTLIRHADHAMYHSKQSGRNQYHLFDTRQDKEIVHKHHLLEEIKQALVNNEFQLYYQPKVNMVTGNVFGAEALIRWIHPEKGLIPPLDFLPIIEGTELEVMVGDWVISQALDQMVDWNEQRITLEVSVNISSHHIQSPLFITRLTEQLAEHPTLDSSLFQLEILESSALGELEAISSIIKTCRYTLGINIALDDFGTGYSSLTHLRNLSANTIKIDQTFVRDMLEDPDDCTIIDGVIGLANSFDREVIAEGVETTEHGLMLLIMGCHEVQGYGISRPMPAADFSKWLNEYTANEEWTSCASKVRTPTESKIKLFRLALKQWQQQFDTNIQSLPDDINDWPIMNRNKCHCGIWIKRARQEKLFEEKWLLQLEEIHDSMHDIAEDIFNKYQNNELIAAREGLKETYSIFEKMSNVLGQCE